MVGYTKYDEVKWLSEVTDPLSWGLYKLNPIW